MMKYSFVSFLSVCLSAAPLFAGKNQLSNDGFEHGLSGWVAQGDKSMNRIVGNAAYRGDSGLEVVDDSSATGSSLYSDRVPVKPGEHCELSFWARLVEDKGLGVYLLFWDADGQLLSTQANGQVVINIDKNDYAWEEFKLEAVAPDKAATVAVWIHSWDASTVVAHLDDFMLSIR
ncbi:carbohydrate binding domain-containing protein [Cerasicoccus frondis]|uniref:carbohydrate binding domain-containing protein n=1 Tax=Cerasicoccus frondis TaxID=490090 RepID=UPI0028528734|nr:carbohydrate binding domain-containing protein [Cerasicoccus frondis]